MTQPERAIHGIRVQVIGEQFKLCVVYHAASYQCQYEA